MAREKVRRDARILIILAGRPRLFDPYRPLTMHDVESCLPEALRGPSTTINRIRVGLSGAGVYRVEAAGQLYALKVWAEDEPLARWQRVLDVQRLAADAGLAPLVVHADEARRAVVSAFVVDRSFAAAFGNPGTRESMLAELGRTLRRVHTLPLPPDAAMARPAEQLAANWSGLSAHPGIPAFARDAVERLLDDEVPIPERAPVLSHNDVNPSNLLFDGRRLLLVDWDHAGPNDPFYDLATTSVFLNMNEGAGQRLLAAYDDRSVTSLPARFFYARRLVAGLCGSTFLKLAGDGQTEKFEKTTFGAALSLAACYQQLRSGSLSLATPSGQWTFGLALLKEAVTQ